MKLLFFLISVFFQGKIIAQNKVFVISVKGEIKNLPTKKIYLTDAFKASKILDSSNYVDGKFSFKFTPQSDDYSRIVSLKFYNDSTGKRNVIVIQNPIVKKLLNTAFSLEDKGTVTIAGECLKIENNSTNPMLILGKSQNKVFYKLQNTDFGFISKSIQEERLILIQSFKETIKKYPYSYYLLQEIYKNKESYFKQELQNITGYFSKEIQATSEWKKLKQFTTDPTKQLTNFSTLYFESDANIILSLIDTTKKINIVVLWASWCAPCRREIPLLKNIYEHSSSGEINIVSLSIDKVEKNWRKALVVENMPWKQLYISKNDIASIKEVFSFSAIPLTIITDKKGNEIRRFIGLEEANKEILIIEIEKELKK